MTDYDFYNEASAPPKHLISLLVPFVSNGDDGRTQDWHWLKQYWQIHLPEAEIIVGRDRISSKGKVPYSKTTAINEAFKRSHGDIIVILDADAYFPASVIRHCAARLRAARRANIRTWFVPYTHLYRLTQEATQLVLDSPPARPRRFSSPPPQKDIAGTDGSGHGRLYGAMCQIMPREAFVLVGGMDCVDETTQILTDTGWRDYYNLNVGDMVLTLNHGTGMSEWQPVEKVNVYPVEECEMLSMESKNHSSLTTMNHRWPTVRRPDYRPGRKTGRRVERRAWATSATLTGEDRIPVTADCADLPLESTHTDALVELVAWFWTEGHIDTSRWGLPLRSVSVSQGRKNARNCERIISALTETFGAPVDSFVRRGKSIIPHSPCWRDISHESKPDHMQWGLNAEAGEIMQKFAPGRVPSSEFLLSLTKSQLDLFIEVSLLADNCGERDLAQKDPASAEAFQFACILAGHGTSIHLRSLGAEKEKKYGYKMTSIRMRTAQKFGPKKGKYGPVLYSGTVWCPTTANETWLARRNGTTWFTGNSKFRGWGGDDVAFLRALDTLWGKHKNTPNDILHLWHKRRTADTTWLSPAKRIWEVRMWDAQTGPGANNALTSRYNRATNNPEAMRALVDESRRGWLGNYVNKVFRFMGRFFR